MARFIFHCLAIAVCFVLTQQQALGANSTTTQKPEPAISFNYLDPFDGTYDYGYMENSTSPFHFEKRDQNNITTGCFGQISGTARGQVTYYIVDVSGYRMVQPDQSNLKLLPENCQRISAMLNTTVTTTTTPKPAMADAAILLPDNIYLDTSPVDVVAQLRAMEDICIDILEIPQQYHNLTRQFPYPVTHYMKCALRCTAIIAGFYTDRDGPNLQMVYKRLYADTGSPISWDQFRADSNHCLSKIPPRSYGAPVDACEKHWPIYRCFERQYYKALGWTNGPPPTSADPEIP